MLTRRASEIVVTDSGSVNRTYINGMPLGRALYAPERRRNPASGSRCSSLSPKWNRGRRRARRQRWLPFFNVLLPPIIAAGAMAFSSVSVVSNAALLKRYTPEIEGRQEVKK